MDFNFLIVLYARYNNGTSKKKAIYEADTRDSAISSFHSYLGAYMKDSTVAHVMCAVIDEYGTVHKNESFTRAE